MSDDEVLCGKYNCTEDMASLDDLKENKCVSIKDYFCYSCETVEDLKNKNNKRFYKNPIEYLFGPDHVVTKDKLDQFWNDLKNNCAIDLAIFEDDEKIRFISPDLDESLKNYNNIKSQLDPKILPYLKSIIDIILLSKDITINILKLEDEIQQKNYIHLLKFKMMDILEEGGWKAILVHEPLELPPVLASILKEINNNKENIFIKFLSEEQQACAEASFEKLYNMLLK